MLPERGGDVNFSSREPVSVGKDMDAQEFLRLVEWMRWWLMRCLWEDGESDSAASRYACRPAFNSVGAIEEKL